MAKPFAKRFEELKETVESYLDDRAFVRGDERSVTRTHHFIHFWVLVITSFVRNRGLLRATALAYTTILALVPMLAVGLGVSTSFLKGESGEKSIGQFVDTLVDQTAPQLGLVPPDAASPYAFTGESIRSLPAFAALLRQQPDPLARFLWNELSPATRARLRIVSEVTEDRKDLKEALAGDLNRIVESGAVYSPERFTNINFSPETQALLEQAPEEGEKLLRLNVFLLRDAYQNNLIKNEESDARDRVKDFIKSFIGNIHSGALGVTGTAALIFIAIGLLSNVEATFNDIWGVKHGRSFLTRVVQYWSTLTLGPLLLVLAMGLSIGGQVSQTQELIQRTLPVIGNWVIVAMVFLAPFLITFMVFMVLYMVIPNTRVDWRAALVGALVACALWHTNNALNVLFASRVVTISKIYGPLSVVPVFLIGLYFSWLILLFGAQVAYTFQYRRAYLQERQTEVVNQRGREFIALRMAACVGQRFQDGQPPPTASEIAEQFGVPVRLVHQVGDALLASNLFTRVTADESAYVPGRPLERISCHDVLEAMRTGKGQMPATLDGPARSLVRGEYERIEEAERRAAAAVSLLDVVNRLHTNVEMLSAGETDAKTVNAPRSSEPRSETVAEAKSESAKTEVRAGDEAGSPQSAASEKAEEKSSSDVGNQSFPL